MKKTFLKGIIIIGIVAMFIVSCSKEKKESGETNTVNEVKALTVTNSLTREEFALNIYPLVEKLYNESPDKYGLIYHIAKKTANEPNPEIYKANLNDFKGEIELIKE